MAESRKIRKKEKLEKNIVKKPTIQELTDKDLESVTGGVSPTPLEENNPFKVIQKN